MGCPEKNYDRNEKSDLMTLSSVLSFESTRSNLTRAGNLLSKKLFAVAQVPSSRLVEMFVVVKEIVGKSKIENRIWCQKVFRFPCFHFSFSLALSLWLRGKVIYVLRIANVKKKVNKITTKNNSSFANQIHKLVVIRRTSQLPHKWDF